MKSLSKYIVEKIGDLNTGFWEPFEDEDTGEVINIWRVYPSKEIIALQKEIDDEEVKIYDEISKMETELDDKSLKSAVDLFKKEYVTKILEENGWNQTKTAQILGIQRTYVIRLMNELNIRKK